MKKILAYILVTMMLLGIVMAQTVTLRLPAASDIVSGSYTLNASVNNYNCNATLCNFTFYALSPYTANSSFQQIAEVLNVNTSVGAVNNSATATFNSNVLLQDDGNYTFNISVTNGSTRISATSANVIVDNWIPTTPVTLLPLDETNTDAASVNFSVVIVGVNTSRCTLNFTGSNPGSPTYLMSEAANQCSVVISSPTQGSYNWFVEAWDRSNLSQSETQQISIRIAGDLGGAGGGGSAPIALPYRRPVTPPGREISETATTAPVRGRSLAEAVQVTIDKVMEWFKSLFNRG